jgi:hypothetical protein
MGREGLGKSRGRRSVERFSTKRHEGGGQELKVASDEWGRRLRRGSWELEVGSWGGAEGRDQRSGKRAVLAH